MDFTKPIANGPTTRGFDYYFGIDVPNYPPYCFIENDRTVGVPSLPAPLQKGAINRPGPMLPGWSLTNIMPELTRRAVRYVEDAAQTNRPFFLYFPLTAPHYPIVPTREFKGRSQAGDYGDFVAQVDGTVGEVLSALARTGLATNTLVIFTSDNGPECVEIDPGAYARIRRYGHWSMDGLRGVKRDTLGRGPPGAVPGALAGAYSRRRDQCRDHLPRGPAGHLRGARSGRSSRPTPARTVATSCPRCWARSSSIPFARPRCCTAATARFAIRQGDWVLIDAPSGDGNGGQTAPRRTRLVQAGARLHEERASPANSTICAMTSPSAATSTARSRRWSSVSRRCWRNTKPRRPQHAPGPAIKNTPASD